MGKVKPKTPSIPDQGIDYVLYIQCLKESEKVRVKYDANKDETFLNFITEDGDVTSCQFVIGGNPYHLAPGERKTFPVEPHSPANPIDLAAAAMLTGFTFGEVDSDGVFHPLYVAQQLKSFSASDFIEILTTLPIEQSYQRFVGLLDGNTEVTGTKFTDHIETGTGNDIVNALGGNDFVNEWNAGNLDYRGGGGFDTLDFSAAVGIYFPIAKTQTLIVDLKTGAGQNPYGGTLTVDSVEKVIGTDAADKIYGSEKADWIETQDYGADLVKARGGNDTVVLWPFANGAKLDGGGGKDTLQTQFEFGENTLDLTDPSKNTGKFENGAIENFEVFNFGTFSFDPLTTLTFRAGAGSETVTVSGSRNVILDMGNGNNRAQGGSGNDLISAGNGKDRIEGGAGGDTLAGGGNVDLFLFKDGHGNDIITDFDAAGGDHDTIDLSGVTSITGWNDLRAHHLTSVNGNATIETSAGDSITLTDVRLKNLDAGDFILA